MMNCTECKTAITRYQAYYCRDCQRLFCAKHIYTRVDEANAAITRNALPLCKECYTKRYGERR
jgi:hypothetical protein